MIDEQMARMRTHRNNIYRYRHLLQTKLTELERDFIEKRLAEEQLNLERLAVSGSTFAAAPRNIRGVITRAMVKRGSSGRPDLSPFNHHERTSEGCRAMSASYRTYSGMPAIRQACDNLSVSSALRNLVLILEIRRPGFSCTRRAQINRASSTRPDIARHAARISCAFR